MISELESMAKINQIRDTSGQLVGYQPSRVIESIREAIQAAGHPDDSLAERVAPMVEFGLSRYFGAVPTSDDIAHCIEQSLRALIDAPEIAEAYVALRRQRIAMRQLSTSAPAALRTGPTVAGATAGAAHGWERSRIEAALIRERQFGAETARGIALAVEERILRTGLTMVGSTLIRALVDAELAERGLLPPGGAPSAYILPSFDLGEAIFPVTGDAGPLSPTSVELEQRVAASVLQQHTAARVHGGESIQAHLDGRLHLEHSSQPTRFAAATLNCRTCLGRGAGIGLETDYRTAAQGPAERTARIGQLATGLLASTAGAVTLARFDTALGNDCPTSELRGLLDRLLMTSVVAGGRESMVWLSFDCLAAEIQNLGSVPALSVTLGWLRDTGAEAAGRVGLVLRVSPELSDDRAGAAMLEQALAIAVSGHAVIVEHTRSEIESSGPGMFPDMADPVPPLACIPAAATLNLLSAFPASGSMDVALPEDKFHAKLEEVINVAVRALQERQEFVRRFCSRKQAATAGIIGRIGFAGCRMMDAPRLRLAGLVRAAELLAGGSDAISITRAAERLGSWLAFAVRSAARRAGSRAVLSGEQSASAWRKFGLAAPLELAGDAPWDGAFAGGLTLASRCIETAEAQLEAESRLAELAPDAISVLDMHRLRLTLPAVMSLVAWITAPGAAPVSRLRVAVRLKQCSACGSGNAADAATCRSCGSTDFRAMPNEASLFDA